MGPVASSSTELPAPTGSTTPEAITAERVRPLMGLAALAWGLFLLRCLLSEQWGAAVIQAAGTGISAGMYLLVKRRPSTARSLAVEICSGSGSPEAL